MPDAKTSLFVITSILFIAIGAVLASAAAITPATGGESISADGATGSWNTLTGPTITESVTEEIKTGTIILIAPAGFVFDTAAPAPTVLLLRNAGSGPSHKNINSVANGTAMNITANNGTQIVFTVSTKSNGGVRNTLVWQDVRIRPTAGTPLASGSITIGGTSVITGVANGDPLGNATEVAGAPADLALIPDPSTITEGDSVAYAAMATDQFGNAIGIVTGTTSFSIEAGAGGSFAANVYTSENVGTWTVTGINGAASDTATLNVLSADPTPPVITLLGSNPVTLSQGTPYADAGATALDNVDGDITGSIVTVNPVNTAVTGTYIVTYDVTDSSGNAAVQATRTVNVVDTGAPAITLLGSDPVTIEVGTPYADAGATAFDSNDGDITASIVTVNPVDANTLGSYVVTYDVTDSSGNPAPQVTRTVNVVDTTAPAITVLGANPIAVLFGAAYTDDGATASDNYDGDITASITTVNPVDTGVLGTYLVTYDVTDSSGNAAAQASRTVMVVDGDAPVITLLGTSPVPVPQGTPYADAGATAFDNADGDITASITTVNPVDTGVLGTYLVTYDVTDSSGNPAIQATRTVTVVDVTAPVITLAGSDPVDAEAGVPYADAGATALDDTDGDLTASIITVNPVDTNTLGTYLVTYDVTDSSGNPAIQATRTVNVVDTGAPAITLLGSDPVFVEVGSAYVEDGATALDSFEGDLTGGIAISGSVDTSTVSTYTVYYDVADSSGNAAQATRTVNVVDTTAPIITLIGSDVTLEVGTPYVDDGATAFDSNDGDLTAAITTVNPVNAAVLDVYIVTYDVTDSEGNAAATVTRTVKVTDTTDPVLTIIGGDVTIEVGTPYADAGATASDNYDGDLTGSVIVTDTVDTSIPGTYLVTYDVTDSSGNSVQATRTVTVTAPATPTGGGNGNPYQTVGAGPGWLPVSDEENSRRFSPTLEAQTSVQFDGGSGDSDDEPQPDLPVQPETPAPAGLAPRATGIFTLGNSILWGSLLAGLLLLLLLARYAFRRGRKQ
jgi:hypothetical protein